MKKTLAIIISITLLVALVSCASMGGGNSQQAAGAEPQTIHVTSIEELAKAAKTKNVTVILDNDIVWSPEYTNSQAFGIYPSKNAIIDLNGHTITGVKHAALRFFGDFTIKNGTLIGEGDGYGLLVNSVNSTSGIDYNPDTRENHKVSVENMKLVECGIRAELSTIKITDCDVQNSGESGNSNALYFVGVEASVSGGKLSQTATAIDTVSRTNCVYCSGYSVVNVTGVVLEGTKRVNAYKNTIAYTVKDCEGAVTTTPDYVSIR